MTTATQEAAELALRARGWVPSHRTYGWWIDPADGSHVPEWRALELARRDQARAADEALIAWETRCNALRTGRARAARRRGSA